MKTMHNFLEALNVAQSNSNAAIIAIGSFIVISLICIWGASVINRNVK